MKDMGNKNEKCYKILEEAKKSLNSKYKFGPVRKQKGWRYYLEIADPRLPFIKRIFLGKDKDDRGINLSFYPADTAEQARPLFEKVAINKTKFLDILKQLVTFGYEIKTNLHVGFVTTGYWPFKNFSFKNDNEDFLNYLDYFISNMDKIRGGYVDMEEISKVAKSIGIELKDDYKEDRHNSNIRTYKKGNKRHSTGLSVRPGFEILYTYGEESDPETYKNDIVARIDNVLMQLISI